MRKKPVSTNGSATTLKISLPVANHIDASSKSNESVDRTLRRLLGFPDTHRNGKEKPQPFIRTVKVSRPVLAFVSKRARPKESRDDTLRRLLGLRRRNG